MAFGQKEEMSQKIALENNNTKNDVGYAINYLYVRLDKFLEVINLTLGILYMHGMISNNVILLYRLNIEVF